MAIKLFTCLLTLLPTQVPATWNPADNWLTEKHKTYTLRYTIEDVNQLLEYVRLVENGVGIAEGFFNSSYKNAFEVYVHPTRASLDSTWQVEWQMPDFKSECWMVASGVASRIDFLSPRRWDLEACEHRYSETVKTHQLITHELVHVFHGQLNVSPDFSNVEGIDWFVEGLATYVSGQCDGPRLNEVKQAAIENKTPNQLDDFWSGRLRYGLSGSMVMFIDQQYGRTKLMELIPLNKKSQLLAALSTTEADLIDNWRKFVTHR